MFYLFQVFYLGVLTHIRRYICGLKKTILLSSYIYVRVLSGVLVITDEPDNQKICSEPFLQLIV